MSKYVQNSCIQFYCPSGFLETLGRSRSFDHLTQTREQVNEQWRQPTHTHRTIPLKSTVMEQTEDIIRSQSNPSKHTNMEWAGCKSRPGGETEPAVTGRTRVTHTHTMAATRWESFLQDNTVKYAGKNHTALSVGNTKPPRGQATQKPRILRLISWSWTDEGWGDYKDRDDAG